MKTKVNVEGGELVLRNEHGDTVIIPRERRKEAMKALLKDDHRAIDSLALQLPKASRYAAKGTVLGGQDPGNGLTRPDGTKKGKGFYGNLPNKNGNISSELSISSSDVEEGKEVLIPTLIPGLSRKEIDYLLSNKYNPQSRVGIDNIISRKAIDFARKRKQQGFPYFAHEIEEGAFKYASGGNIKPDPSVEGIMGPETTITAPRPEKSIGNFFKRWGYENSKGGSESLLGAIGSGIGAALQLPQAAVTYMLDPKGNVLPSKALQGTQIQKDIEMSAAQGNIGAKILKRPIVQDMLLDPLNLVGVGLTSKLSKVDKIIDATKAGSKVLNKTDDVVKNLFKFKSEIDWSKWNKEIPENKKLIQEYNLIEQQAKANGTWMKNPDGSTFKGTPEQFVQQNSENFKKAFPNPIKDINGNIQINYHGSPRKLEGNFFDESKSGKYNMHGKGIYTSKDKKMSEIFMNKLESDDKTLYELYINSNTPQNDLNNYYRLKKEAEDAIIKHGYGSSEHFTANQAVVKEFNLQAVGNDYLKEGHDFVNLLSNNEYQLIPFSNFPKSAIGNNGMFDMTNPNIYKALAPTIIAGALALQLPKASRYAAGGTVLNGEDPLNPYEYQRQYSQSPRFKQMLQEGGYPKMKAEERAKNVETVGINTIDSDYPDAQEIGRRGADFRPNDVKSLKSNYDKANHNITLDMAETRQLDTSLDDILSHELGHASLGTRGISKRDANLLTNKVRKDYKSTDVNPIEMQADFNAMRYHLHSKGLDVFNKKLNVEDVKKVLQRPDGNIYSKDVPMSVRRMLDTYKLEDAVKILNTVADKSNGLDTFSKV